MSSLLHRSLSTTPPTVVSGRGARLTDDRGRVYLDASGGAAVSCLGHGNERVRRAIAAQLDAIAYAHTSFFTNEPAERLATALVARAPEGFGSGRAMFLGSGSEAVEAALKLARQYHVERGEPQRHRIIAREMAYHGNTLGALAAGGHRQRRAPYLPMLAEVARIPACFPYRGRHEGEDEEAFGRRMADALEDEILRLGPQTVAAFVAEPVAGASLGSVPPAAGYFARIRDICDRHGVLFIADEVMCGSGRTGSFFALEQEGVSADIITLAKGLGAGFQPIAAVLACGKVVEAIAGGSGTLWHGHTYMSHAVGCACALAVLEELDERDLLANVRRQGHKLGQKLLARFGQSAHIGDVRGRGLFWSVEIVADRTTKAPFDPRLRMAAMFKKRAQELGLLCYPSSGCVDGERGDHVLVAPPYDVEDDDLDLIVDLMGRTLDDCIAVAGT